MNYYSRKKGEAIDEAIEWQLDFANHNYFMSELVKFAEHFYKLGKRFGLLKEFRENGII